MCAIEAGKRGRRVAVLEHAERLGKKILISGGGRCNFTNIHCSAGKLYLGQSALRQVRLGSLYACRLHRAGRETPHSLSRKNSGSAFLRSLCPGHSGHAGKECRENGVQLFTKTAIHEVTRTDEFVATPEKENFALRRWSWPPADCRFPRWGPPDLAMTWRGNSG